jgi:hypothetical protein
VVSKALGLVRVGRTNRAFERSNSAPIYHIRSPISDIKGGLEGGVKGSRGRPCGSQEPRAGTIESIPDIPYPSSDIRYHGRLGGWFQGSRGRPCGAPEPCSGAPEIGPDIPYLTSDIRYKGYFGDWVQGLSASFVWAARTALWEPLKSARYTIPES